jgi:hypothetical protein
MPIGSLAADFNGNCNLFLQYLDDETQPQSNQVVLGSMFLQQYINYWAYNYNTETPTTTYYMQISSTNSLTGSYIGNAAYT